MKYKNSLLGLICIFINAAVCSQYNFDGIKICHTSKQLSEVCIGEYSAEVNNGKLLSVSSKDSAIVFDAMDNRFFIKNLTQKSDLTLQLLDNGVAIRARDTTIILNSPASINSIDTAASVQVLYSLHDFSFLIEFKNNKVNRISLATTNKYIVIDLIYMEGAYTWDFLIESARHENKLLLTFINKEPYSLHIESDKDRVGIRLLAEKKNGRITLLQGLKLYENNSFMSDKSYWLRYANNGKMKKSVGFKINCQK